MIVFFAVTPQFCRADATDDYNLALQLYKQERWEQAAAQWERFLSAAPTHEKAPLAKLYLGQSLVHQRDFVKARPVFREFVRSHPEHAEIALALYRIGECSYFLNDAPQARKELRDFLGKVPAEHELVPWALQYLGESELRLGNFQDAAGAFERLLAQYPEGPLAEESRFGLARAFDGLKRTDEADALYRKLAENPQGLRAADAEFSLAARQFSGGKYAAAAAGFDAVAQRFPQHRIAPLAVLNAGFSRYHLGEFPAAIQAFESLSTDERHGRTARYWLALSRKSQNEFAAAGELLITLFREDEQQPLAESLLFHAADCKLRSQEYGEAVRLFVDVADRFPQGELADDALYSALEAALSAGDLEEAERLNQRFIKQFPESGLELPVGLLSGRLLLARGDQLRASGNEPQIAEAQQLYRQAADGLLRVLESSTVPKTQALARLHLARTWERLNNQQRLIEVLEPLAQGAAAAEATEEQRRALMMQSNAWLILKDYDRALETAQRYLEAHASGSEAPEAWANVALARAHRNEWEPALAAVSRVQESGAPDLAARVGYEVAEAAYRGGRWDDAQGLYEHVLQQGPANEFYVPSLSGLAFSLHESARVALKESEQAAAAGQQFGGTGQLAEAVSRFDAAAREFGKLAELAGRGGDLRVQSNAAYMQGLSLKLARRLAPASERLVAAGRQFSLPQDIANPSPDQLAASMNAYRAWKEAARALSEMGHVDQAGDAYQAALQELKRQPADARRELDLIINEWALLYYNAEQFDRSDELFRLLIAETPQSQWADDAKLLLAESDFFADRFEAARDAFRSLVSDPQTDEFVRQRALLLLVDAAVELEDWKTVSETATDLRTLLVEKAPETSDRWYAEYRLAEAALRAGEARGAADQLQKLIDDQANTAVTDEKWFPSVWLMLAESQLRLKEYDAVDETVARFKRENPESPF
ncbi:MAG: tetratricopeptide repeat protein, partial [Planctomycetaceae bacterium]|nr:tetratricopeptide repeat protein [Planctomycetaceae bacterium]